MIIKQVSRQLPDDAVEILRAAAIQAEITGLASDNERRSRIVKEAIYRVRLMYPHLFNKEL